MKIMKAVFIFMLDGNQMFQMSMSTNDKRLLVTWNSLLKVLNNNAVFKPTVSLLNMKIHKAFIIRDLLNETPLCRLHNEFFGNQWRTCQVELGSNTGGIV